MSRSAMLHGLALGGCLIGAISVLSVSTSRAGSQSSVNKSISVTSGGKTDRVRSVNGNVRLAGSVAASSVSNINGNIRLSDGNSVSEVSNVNGDIQAGNSLLVKKDVSNVNGEITLGAGAQIGGEISTVNGGISQTSGSVGSNVNTVNGDVRLGQVKVAGNITTVWGDVELNGAAVEGNLRVTKPRQNNYWGKPTPPPRIVLGAGSKIDGGIILEQPAAVYVHQTAVTPSVTGTMVGGAVITFNGAQPPVR